MVGNKNDTIPLSRIESLRQSASSGFQRVASAVGIDANPEKGGSLPLTRTESIRQTASGSLTRAASAIGIETRSSQESDALEELTDLCPKLSYQQVRGILDPGVASGY